jgi:AraC-like DNA-binding protein
MKEDEKEYEIGPGHMLLLEPGMTHEGYRPCEEETEVIWVHIKHDYEQQRMVSSDIPWSLVLRKGTDLDAAPANQPIYVPKFGCFELDEVWNVLEEMVRLHNRLLVGSAIQLQALFVQLLVQLQLLIRGAATESAAGRLAAAVAAYLRKHADEPLQLIELEEVFHFNRDYINRCLKRHTGMTPVEYLRHIRMDKACRLLEHSPGLSIKQIGTAVGIEDANYFIRLFQKEKGITPAAYRRKRQGYT